MPDTLADRRMLLWIAGVALIVGACHRELVRIVPDGPSGATAAPSDPTFEVVARINGARDPLPVGHTDVAYADLERTLAQAIVRSVAPRHESVLTVELVADDAHFDESKLNISMVARATLRTRVGNVFVAQKQFVCRDGAIVAPEAGGRVVWSCMSRIGQDLGGWLADLPR
jgi:hypothetical protein